MDSPNTIYYIGFYGVSTKVGVCCMSLFSLLFLVSYATFKTGHILCPPPHRHTLSTNVLNDERGIEYTVMSTTTMVFPDETNPRRRSCVWIETDA